jgi:exodeoxyribonuclease VII small subunit
MTSPTRSDANEAGPGENAIGYAEAVAELEQILNELERNDVDIDVLGPRVQRAAALIRLCRDRIASARLDVEQIVSDLDGNGERPDPDDNPSESP